MAQITFIARMTVKTGSEAEFIRLCKHLEQHVIAHEKGIDFYRFVKYTDRIQPTSARYNGEFLFAAKRSERRAFDTDG